MEASEKLERLFVNSAMRRTGQTLFFHVSSKSVRVAAFVERPLDMVLTRKRDRGKFAA